MQTRQLSPDHENRQEVGWVKRMRFKRMVCNSRSTNRRFQMVDKGDQTPALVSPSSNLTVTRSIQEGANYHWKKKCKWPSFALLSPIVALSRAPFSRVVAIELIYWAANIQYFWLTSSNIQNFENNCFKLCS